MNFKPQTYLVYFEKLFCAKNIKSVYY